MKTKSKILILLLSVAIMLSTQLVVAETVVDLGTAGNFVILAKSGISTTGTTSIIGDIGVSPIDSTAITGFGLIMDSSNQFATSSLVTGSVYAADYTAPTPATMTTAISDMETAYTNASGRTLPDYTELGAGNIGGMTLTPGLYKWSTGVTIPTDVTLSGNSTDIWVFQIAGTLDISNGKKVLLSGGAQASNIFWQVADQTTLGTTSVFNGNILDQTAIVLNTGATLNGRALAQTAVTLDANIISSPAAPQRVLTTITLSPASADIILGSTQQFNATGLDQFNATILSSINYTTSNSSVATVNVTSGLVTSVNLGNTIITASGGNISGSANVSVSPIVVEASPASGGGGGSSGGKLTTTRSTKNNAALVAQNEKIAETTDIETPEIIHPETIKTFSLSEGASITFNPGGTTIHKLTVLGTTSGSTTIQIESEPIIFNLLVGESRKIDLDRNEKDDLEVKLISITNNEAEITMVSLQTTEEPKKNEEAPTTPTNSAITGNVTSNISKSSVWKVMLIGLGAFAIIVLVYFLFFRK